MAFETNPYALKITRVAGADLTGAQFKFVKQNSAGAVVAVAAVTDRPIGVLQNAPKNGEEAEVLVIGDTKIVAGSGGIDEGNILGTDSTGKTVVKAPGTDTTHYILGTATLAASADEIGTAVINCASAGRAS